MSKLILIFFAMMCFFLEVSSSEKFKLSEITGELSEPWGMSFVDDQTLLITEKTGDIVRIDTSNGNKYIIEHNLDYYYYGQGGLLDILYKDGYVYVSYSEDRENGDSSTSIARGIYNEKKIDFQELFKKNQK